MVASLDDLISTVDRVQPIICNLPAGSSTVFRYAMSKVNKFLNDLKTDLSQANSTPDVFNVIEKFHDRLGNSLTVLDGVNNKAELSTFMKQAHAQISNGLAELSRARFNPPEFYEIIDKHLAAMGDNFKAYRNPTHKEIMCNIGSAITENSDEALQWEAVGRIAAILEKMKK